MRHLTGAATAPSAALLLAALASAGEAKRNPLADLPSKPGPHVRKIEALGENQWLELGKPAPDPKWGVARGRSWAARMAYAPDLRGAFYCGTGRHGYVKPDGHYMDDLWFYDANSHRWICLYPGADTKTVKLKLDGNRFEVNDRGENNPVSYLSHAYSNVTYVTHLRKYMLIYTYCPWWTKALPQRAEWLGVGEKDRGNPYRTGRLNGDTRHPVFWDVEKGRWERVLSEGGKPMKRFEGVLEYIPSMRKAIYTYRGKAYLYDFAKKSWSPFPGEGARVPESVSRYDSNGCYDPRRERVWIAKGKGFAYLDLRAGKWTEISAQGQPENLRATNFACLTFDTASGHVIWHERYGRVVAYDPEAGKWITPERTFPNEVDTRHKTMSAFHDPELNVHFYYLAADSGNRKATIVAYRYRKAAGK